MPKLRVTYANVTSTLALLLALGGAGAYAAEQLGSSDIAKNAIKSKHVKDGQVKTVDLADDSVTAFKVANGSLRGEDFAPGQLPSGATGPPGPEGPPGPSTGPAGGDLSGSYPDPTVAANAITGAKILDETISLPDLGGDSVDSAKVVDDSLDGADVADTSSLGAAEINEAGLDSTVLQSRIGASCPAGQAVRSVNQNGSVVCENSIAGPPTGAAGGDLAGSYPNPTLRADEALHYVGATGQPGFVNGWANFGSYFAKAAFYKDRSGIVHLQGLVNGGTYGSPNTTGRIFTVPVGYTPCVASPSDSATGDLVFGTISNNAIGRITVYDMGSTASVGAEAGSGWISLDGISWRASGC